MDLEQYLWEERLTYHSFSKMIYVSQPTVAAIARREHSPGLLIGTKIVEITKGKVTYEDMLTEADKDKVKKMMKQHAKTQKVELPKKIID